MSDRKRLAPQTPQVCVAHGTLEKLIESKFETLQEKVEGRLAGIHASQMEGVDMIILELKSLQNKVDITNGQVKKHTQEITVIQDKAEKLLDKVNVTEIDLRFMKWVRKNWHYSLIILFIFITIIDIAFRVTGWDVAKLIK